MGRYKKPDYQDHFAIAMKYLLSNPIEFEGYFERQKKFHYIAHHLIEGLTYLENFKQEFIRSYLSN